MCEEAQKAYDSVHSFCQVKCECWSNFDMFKWNGWDLLIVVVHVCTYNKHDMSVKEDGDIN